MFTTASNIESDFFGSVSLPQYSRPENASSIVHLGVGNFHRAHLAAYLDELMSQGKLDWQIIGAGIRVQDEGFHQILNHQAGMYTLIEASQQSERARVIGSLSDYLWAHHNPNPLIQAMADSATKIVSLTITEGGYPILSDGAFDQSNPSIQADIESPYRPTSAFGFILMALQIRHAQGLEPFTVLSCDNIQGNGDATKTCLLSLADKIHPHLIPWLDSRLSCPNSMVDRITPALSPQLLEHLQTTYQSKDRIPVLCETDRALVVQDMFPLGRPDLEKLGVHFTDSVHPYETMKMRMLNGGHSLIAYLGALCGYQTIHETMADDSIRKIYQHYLRNEVAPSLEPVPCVNLEDYQQQLIRRFQNHRIADTVARVAASGSSKLPKFIYPTIEINALSGRSIELLTLAIAGWLTYLQEQDFERRSIQAMDDRKLELQGILQEAVLVPSILFNQNTRIFPDSIASIPQFQLSLLRHLKELRLGNGRSYVDAMATALH